MGGGGGRGKVRGGWVCVCGKKEGTHSVGEHSGRGKGLGEDADALRRKRKKRRPVEVEVEVDVERKQGWADRRGGRPYLWTIRRLRLIGRVKG